MDHRIRPLVVNATDHIRRYFGQDTSALYLRGSAARDDWVPGLSDLDLYVVVKDNLLATQNIKSELETILQSVSPEPRVSCRVVTESDLARNRVGSYLTSLDSQLLFGGAVLEGLQAPTLDELRVFGGQYSEYLGRYWQEIRNREYSNLEEKVRRVCYMVLKSAQSILITHGIVVLQKDGIANTFRREFRDLPLVHVVTMARDIRSSWPKPLEHKRQLSLFCGEADSFLSSTERYLKLRRPASMP